MANEKNLRETIATVDDFVDDLETRIPGVVQPQTGDSYARLGAPAGASVSADMAAVKSDAAAVKAKTDNLPASPAAQAKLDTLHDTRIPGIIQAQTGDSYARIGAPAGVSLSADMAAVKTDTAALLVDTGDGADAAAAPGAAGSLHGHVREAQEQADTIQTEVNKIGTPAGASLSADIAAVKTETAALLVDTGDGTDAAVAAGVAGSLHGHIRSAQVEVNKIGTPAGASVSADIAAVKTETAAILADTGDGTDAAVAAGVAGSLHGHVRSVQVEVNKIGSPAGASVSADIAAVKADTAAIAGYVDAEVAAIKAKTDNLGQPVATAAAVLADGTSTIFTIAGGPIEVEELLAICVTGNDGTATTLQFAVNATAGGQTTVSAASASLANVAAGTSVLCRGIFASAPTITAGGTVANGTDKFIAPAGTLQSIVATGPSTGTWKFYLRYRPLATGITVS